MRNSLYMSAAYTLIAVGAITIIISFLGCMGSFAENRILLLTYFVFVLLLFVVLLIGGVLAYVFRYQKNYGSNRLADLLSRHEW